MNRFVLIHIILALTSAAIALWCANDAFAGENVTFNAFAATVNAACCAINSVWAWRAWEPF